MNKGLLAEAAVADFLENEGYKIIKKNWRTKACEVDIIASKGKVVYIIEVKYRSSDSFGEGFDYITGQKRRKLELAARLWQQISGWDGEISILIASVSGAGFERIELIDY